MVYDISEKGAEDFKNLAKSILNSCNDIMEASGKLKTTVDGLSGNLGIYSEEILDLIQENQRALLNHKSEFEGLAQRISKKGDEILEMLVLDDSGGGGGGSEGSAAGAGANGTSGASTSTIKENCCAALVSNGYAANADFGNLDDRTAQSMAMGIVETKELFPELDLKFVGSLQSRNEKIRERLTEIYMQAYKSHYPDASEADLLPVIRQQVEEDTRGFNPDERTIAQSMFLKSPSDAIEQLYSLFNGITINEQYGADYDDFLSVKQEDVRAGWKPIGCDTPKATVDHELGHQIDKLVGASDDPDIQKLYRWFSSLDEGKQSRVLSGYAADSIGEFIAESWSEYRNNPDCRDCAKYVAERMIELYQTNPPLLRKVLRR